MTSCAHLPQYFSDGPGASTGGSYPYATYCVLTIIVITTIMVLMQKSSQSENKPRLAPCPEEVAYLELLRSTDMLSRPLALVLKPEDLSSTQYNVLRILRGAPDGLPCGEIGSRMITRDPDITRLLDRLEKRALISRSRESKDRRMVMARITTEGLKLLSRLDEPVREVHRRQLGHLGRERLRMLTELLRESRSQLG
jgi:DNA-binding MarR family transcriptional regulator